LGHNDKVEALRQLASHTSECFPDQTFDPIPANRRTQTAADRNPKSHHVYRVPGGVDSQPPVRDPTTMRKNPLENPLRLNPGTAGKGLAMRVRLRHDPDYTPADAIAPHAVGGYRSHTLVTRNGRRDVQRGLNMDLRDFQQLIETMYSHKDRERGSAGTFLWLMEEVGELAQAIGEGADRSAKAAEFADVMAWLVTLANVEGVDLSEALHAKYGQGCPGCGKMVCTCSVKP
jgi:NTP pyrophosphatase (non-canonical NTP hydrolase)